VPASNSPARRVFLLLQAALEDLPAQYSQALSNIDFAVTRVFSPRERRRRGIQGTLYGLYEGIPLTHRDSGYDRAVPDRITLFWGPLVKDFPDDGRLEREVRNTVYHEIAHHFGLDEEDLHNTRVE
jgi:predicted Zn-dependent protease with MMP-like domain